MKYLNFLLSIGLLLGIQITYGADRHSDIKIYPTWSHPSVRPFVPSKQNACLSDLDDTIPLLTPQCVGFEEKVIMKSGKDGRERVYNTDTWPYSVHGVVLMESPSTNKHYRGSGTLIGPNIVLTAAHNVRNVNNGDEDLINVRFLPGANGSIFPFGEPLVTGIKISPDYYSGNPNYECQDYALLVLDRPIGNVTGWFGISVFDDSQIEKLTVSVTGYPGDKCKNNDHQLWSMRDKIVSFQLETLSYYIDTYPGQSGSGLWYSVDKESYYVVGIHTHGSLSGNTANRLSKNKYDQIHSWIKDSVYRNPIYQGVDDWLGTLSKIQDNWSIEIRDLFSRDRNPEHLSFKAGTNHPQTQALIQILPHLRIKSLEIWLRDTKSPEILDNLDLFLPPQPDVTKLYLIGSNDTHIKTLSKVFHCSQLIELKLEYGIIHDGTGAMDILCSFSNLTCLDNYGMGWGEERRKISTLTKLERLSIPDFNDGYNKSIINRDSQFLLPLKNLTDLNLHCCFFKQDEWKSLTSLIELRKLNLSNNCLHDDDTCYLSSLTTLNELDLSMNKLGPLGAYNLISLVNLQKLNLKRNNIQDMGVTIISHFTHLKEVKLGNNALSDNGIKFLLNWKNKNPIIEIDWESD